MSHLTNQKSERIVGNIQKTMRMIQYVKDQFDFPDLEAERKLMYADGLNDPDYEL